MSCSFQKIVFILYNLFFKIRALIMIFLTTKTYNNLKPKPMKSKRYIKTLIHNIIIKINTFLNKFICYIN